eukprot:scaffold105474_cov31-Attheya_sp.AAC.1
MGPAHVFAWRTPPCLPQLSHRVGRPPKKVSGREVAPYNQLSLPLARKPPLSSGSWLGLPGSTVVSVESWCSQVALVV